MCSKFKFAPSDQKVDKWILRNNLTKKNPH